MFNKKIKSIISGIALTALAVSCADLQVDNLNSPDESRAITSPLEYIPLLEGSTANVFFKLNDFEGVHMDGLADFMTATNRAYSFWDFTHQPRLRLNNTTGYTDKFIIETPWNTFYSGISAANDVIGVIVNDNVELILPDSSNVTQQYLAAAYFLRGVATGYLGLIYDQALIIDENAAAGIVPSPYADVIEASIADFEKAIVAANAAGASFTWDVLPSPQSLNRNEFIAFIRSFQARILLGKARTNAEADALPDSEYDRILAFANAGAGKGAGAPANFAFGTVQPYIFYHNYADWSAYYIGSNGYLPVDVRVMHLLDPNYLGGTPPFDFKVQRDGSQALLPMGTMNSVDPRSAYYYYDAGFGFLSQARDLRLFTQYQNDRIYGDNDWGADSNYPVTYFIAAEMDYIIAEAQLRKGNKAAAAAALNASPFGTGITDLSPLNTPGVALGYFPTDGFSGGYSIDASAPDASFVYALQKEQAVELTFFANIGSNWFFMRRHDLLQTGTPLHYPIPGGSIEIVPGLTYYSFGGEDFASDPNNASGAANWRTNMYSTVGITAPTPKVANNVEKPKKNAPMGINDGKSGKARIVN